MNFVRCIVVLCLLLPEVLVAQSASLRAPLRFLRSEPSDRNLVRHSPGEDPFHENHVDTLRVLALRVEFQPDTLEETTGDGRFLLQPPEEPTIDPPPHDRAYFEAQLQALANYFASVSNGKLHIVYEVYPRQDTAVYVLPHDMSYYAPEEDDPLVDTRLAELLRDAVQTADAQDSPPFADFDSFIIFHAGVGRDVNFDFDPTPNDVPSAYLNLRDLQKGLAPDDPAFAGIPLQNGAFHLRDGIILPETESQEGFEIGLLGTAAIMMGFQLGLPALFNPETGASGIGRWGLMDQGSGNFQGMLPAQPCAWEKVFLGWEKPIVIHHGIDFRVASALSTLSPNHVYKIPINADEYFLLENRERDVNGDGIAVGRDAAGRRVEFKDPGQIIADGPIGVIVSVDEYDFGLPGSGILIWHIDESVIRAGLAENRVNSNRKHLGVDLEEADGPQDIGQFYGFLDLRFGAENGIPEDAWFRDNASNKTVNGADSVRFGPDTHPNSRSNRGADSHIEIFGFGPPGELMNFSVRNTLLLAGFPVFVGTRALPPIPADVNLQEPGREIVVADSSGGLFVVTGAGVQYGALTVTSELSAPGRELRTVTFTRVLQQDGPLAAVPAAGDLDGDGAVEVLLPEQAGRLTAIDFAAAANGVAAEVLWQAEGPGAGPAAVAADATIWWISGDQLLHLDANGNVLATANLSGQGTQIALAPDAVWVATAQSAALFAAGDGSPLWQANLPAAALQLAVADLENDGEIEYLVLTTDGQVMMWHRDGAEVRRFAVGLDPPTGLSLGDVDGDGRKDVVIASPARIAAWNYAGGLLERFPYPPRGPFPQAQGAAPQQPILADLDGDGAQEVFWIDGRGDLYGLSREGPAEDFPFAFSARAGGQLAVADINGDGELELVGVNGDGFLVALRLEGSRAGARHGWPVFGADPRQSQYNDLQQTPQQTGGPLLAPQSVYNYPNPTRGDRTFIRFRVNEPARVTIKIMDLAGELVDELEASAVPFVDNEVAWPLQNIQSGVYFARVEAHGESGTETAICKIAVVK